MELEKAERQLLERTAKCVEGIRTLQTGELAPAMNLEKHGLGKIVGEEKMRHFRINEAGERECAR